MRTAGQGPGGFEKRDGFIKPGQDLVVAGFAGLAGIFISVASPAAPEVPAFLRTYREISFVPSGWLSRISVSDAAPFTGISVQDDAVSFVVAAGKGCLH